MLTPDTWTFADRSHLVYERPVTDTRWPVPLYGFKAAGYQPYGFMAQRPGAETVEPLTMTAVGHPSVTLGREGMDGPTVQTISLNTQYADLVTPDLLGQLQPLAESWVLFCRAMSGGPLTRDRLRAMHHPYGYMTPGWAGLRGGPRGKREVFHTGWHMKGVRGAVPPLSVINRDSGWLEENWFGEVRAAPNGVQVRIINLASYSWFLAHGTVKLQAHGPWQEAVDRFLAGLQQAWRDLIRGAVQRRKAAAAMWGMAGIDRPGDMASLAREVMWGDRSA
jgi:hypothetical protein